MKKATIKDIAEAAEVSISSVHLALTGKSGVSEATRERVRQIAEEMGYKPNILASNLKRGTRRVAVILPPQSDRSTYYFGAMWDALADYKDIAENYNLELVPFTCSEEGMTQFNPNSFDGIISVGIPEFNQAADFLSVSASAAPLILLDSDVPESGRLCCVDSSPEAAGLLTAELLTDMIHRQDGEILVMGAGPSYETRRRTEEALLRGLTPVGLSGKVRILHCDGDEDSSQKELCEILSNSFFIGACAVNSRATKLLGSAISELGQTGYFPVVGSGSFAESRDCLKRGAMTVLIDKQPYKQCTKAMNAMRDLLVSGITPTEEELHVKLDIIFRSNLDPSSLINK